MGKVRLGLAFLPLLLLALIGLGSCQPQPNDARLVIPTGDQLAAVGKPKMYTCEAEVITPELVKDLKWYWPDGQEILPLSLLNRVELLTEQAGALSLYFSSAQPEDEGTYRCTATYANTQYLTANFTLKTYVPITFEDAQPNQFAVKNTDYKVKCRVRGDPQPIIDWKKDHRAIVSSVDDDHIVIDHDGILIKGVREEDEGVYTCRVRVVQLGHVEERAITLEVQEKPRITDPPSRQGEMVEGGDFEMRCAGVGKPPPEILWTRRGQNLYGIERHTVDKYTGTLRIDNVHIEDEGEYYCRALNAAGFDEVVANMKVITKPVIMEFINKTTQVEGYVEINCKARGNPLPTILFQKDSVPFRYSQGAQADQRLFLEQTVETFSSREGDFYHGEVTSATLKISDVLRTDDGLYNCIATNGRVETERLGHLTVEFLPTFVNTPMKENWSWDARPVNLTCLAEAIPNATINWFFVEVPEREVVESINIRRFGYESVSSLEIRPVDRRMFGHYRCVATNKLGTAQHTIYLREGRRPGHIQQVIVQYKTATSIAFKIVPPTDDGGLPIDSIVVQYRHERDTWDNPQVINWPVDHTLFVIEGLESLKTYAFRFAASSQVGIGDWAQERLELMPRQTVPDAPLIRTESYQGIAHTPYPNQFELLWTVPPDNGERIEYFKISRIPVSNSSGYWATYGSVREEILPFGEPRHVLRDLASGTYYKVEIRAHNIIGDSEPAEIIIKTAPNPGGSIYDSVVSRNKQAALSFPVIIALALMLVLITLILVDVTCYRMRQTGIIWGVTHSLCRKKRPSHTNGNAHNGKEKESRPLRSDERPKQPTPDPGNIYSEPLFATVDDGSKANGNKKGGSRTSDNATPV